MCKCLKHRHEDSAAASRCSPPNTETQKSDRRCSRSGILCSEVETSLYSQSVMAPKEEFPFSVMTATSPLLQTSGGTFPSLNIHINVGGEEAAGR